jgi:L,D-transpeptidase YcbB
MIRYLESFNKSARLVIAVSKQILLPVWLCLLLGACALNTFPVVAEVTGGQESGIHDAANPTAGAIHARQLLESDGETALTTPSEGAIDETHSMDAADVPPSLPLCPTTALNPRDEIAVQICQRVRTDPPPTRLYVDNQRLSALEFLVSFYTRRDYQPAWLSAEGAPLPVADALLESLRDADREGLRAADYRSTALKERLADLRLRETTPTMGQLTDFDLLFTDTFLTYGSHLLSGRLSPRKVDRDWTIPPRSRDLAAVLQEALTHGTLPESLRALKPLNHNYSQLREVLESYRKVEQAGGWPILSDGPNLRQGDQGPRVRTLRARLRAGGDLAEGRSEANQKESAVFDKTVTEAVLRFQRRHGLQETGVVGPLTRAALNVPVSERIRQVELNMERWRWLPDEFGTRYILVNIPDFKMDVFENGQRVMESKVVVGQLERQTPIFTADMTYLVLSPRWHIPRSIAVRDKLPQLRRNPQALARQNIQIFTSGGQRVDPGAVDWSAVTARNFNYQLRQEPGPRNALGGVKFMFPNSHNVYLHDTPSRDLFNRNQRTFSSGCIRISNPLELAEYLLRHDPQWSQDALKRATTRGRERVVNLPEAVPVYLLYWTAWVDDEGLVHFRDDIYRRDQLMVKALYPDRGVRAQRVARGG